MFPDKVDEKVALAACFGRNFIEKGGYFRYCTSEDAYLDSLRKICQVRDLKQLFCENGSLGADLDQIDAFYQPQLQGADAAFLRADALCSTGFVCFKSQQKWLMRMLPKTLIIKATVRDIAKEISPWEMQFLPWQSPVDREVFLLLMEM